MLNHHAYPGSPAHRCARLLLRCEKPVAALLADAAAEMRAFPENAILPQTVNAGDRQQVEAIATLLLTL